jgi:hypothetical protein
MTDEWEPAQSDLEWTERTLGLLRDGGTWITTFASYEVHHKARVITCFPFHQLSPGAAESHARVKKVLNILGWQVQEQEGP